VSRPLKWTFTTCPVTNIKRDRDVGAQVLVTQNPRLNPKLNAFAKELKPLT